MKSGPVFWHDTRRWRHKVASAHDVARAIAALDQGALGDVNAITMAVSGCFTLTPSEKAHFFECALGVERTSEG